MRALALLLLLAACSPSTNTGFESPTGQSFTLSIVSGDNQSAVAVVQPVVLNLGGPASQPVTPSRSTPLAAPLVVLVTRNGLPVDGVLLRFSDPDPQTGVIGLGTMTSGYDVTTPSWSFPATRGEAAMSAQPYRQGVWPVTVSVDPSAGTGNVLTFRVTGT